MAYVNKVKKGSEEWDIQDARIPEAEQADEGKVVKVNAEGEYVLANVSGGTKLYKHKFASVIGEDTHQITLISADSTGITIDNLLDAALDNLPPKIVSINSNSGFVFIKAYPGMQTIYSLSDGTNKVSAIVNPDVVSEL